MLRTEQRPHSEQNPSIFSYKENKFQREPKKEWKKLQKSNEIPKPATMCRASDGSVSELKRNGTKHGESARPRQNEVINSYKERPGFPRRWTTLFNYKPRADTGFSLWYLVSNKKKVTDTYVKEGRFLSKSSVQKCRKDFPHPTKHCPFYIGIKMRPPRGRPPGICTLRSNSVSQHKKLKLESGYIAGSSTCYILVDEHCSCSI